jgi:hypothetical protein
MEYLKSLEQIDLEIRFENDDRELLEELKDKINDIK